MTDDPRQSLADILTTACPTEKAARATQLAEGGLKDLPTFPVANWPGPARRTKPALKPPSEMPKRGLGTLAGRQALLHAIAHIELNAIDLAADMAGRFAHDIPTNRRDEFVADWLSVMGDEARHFMMVARRLEEMGTRYGALPAHDGLFDAAARTSDDFRARLAIAPLVLEARGLDVTPGMIDRLRRSGDDASADILEVIYTEEIGHVATGIKWFRLACESAGDSPAPLFKSMVEKHFPGGLKRPFNDDAREQAGFERQWYEGLARK
ncbi:MAG: ferritin-like domain-containing protein [Pseudomonadota bacterium]